MLLKGRPLLAHILERVRCREALVVTRTPDLYEDFGEGVGVRGITDRIANGGPRAGLQAAFAEARTDWVALVAGDMPWLRQDVLDRLAEGATGEDAWRVFAREGRLEPLPGLYRRSALAPKLPALLARGAGLMALPGSARGTFVDVEALRALDGELESLGGVNTPEEAARYGVTQARTKP